MGHDLRNQPFSPWDESEADRVTQALNSPHPSDFNIPLNDNLTLSQQGSRITRQTHDAIFAPIATIQERSQYGLASYCCFIDFATASVHRESLGLTLKNSKIAGKNWID